MKKKFVILFLFIFVLSLLSGCSQSSTNSNNPESQVSKDNSKPQAEKIQIMNFHATQRCAACTALGKYSEETINEFFQTELRDGIIEFKSINVDLPENRAVATKYQAAGSSLFINAIYDGKDHIEEDVRVWRLLSDEQQFKSYLKKKIKGLLNK